MGFNSTMVRLKVRSKVLSLKFGKRFNSTMVRLKGEGMSEWLASNGLFQFHNGSIKSPNNQQKILYKTRVITTRKKSPPPPKVVNVRLCKIHGGLTTARGYASNP